MSNILIYYIVIRIKRLKFSKLEYFYKLECGEIRLIDIELLELDDSCGRGFFSENEHCSTTVS